MTPREKQIYDVLTDEFKSDSEIARLAGFGGWYARENAAKFCIKLTRIGLAERRGPRMLPEWRRAPGRTGTAAG